MRPSIPAGAALESYFTHGDEQWALYVLPLDDERRSFLWQRFKLMAPGSMPRRIGAKRCVWLNWNPLETRFARHQDSHYLTQHMPALYEAVVQYMKMFYGPESLAVMYSPEEIAAEQARLHAQAVAARRARRA